MQKYGFVCPGANELGEDCAKDLTQCKVRGMHLNKGNGDMGNVLKSFLEPQRGETQQSYQTFQKHR